ncbi:MAG: UDP-N-acetylglucosamine 1-carboxyvinyltransferase [Firmicutes bacterium]|jgi:UDP-N-acetylglucosamine 1-carboxyvinyltransferase|nr:UDP-N-acetylglucosamine 1-carboxyvinyltransferase [Bacillota bacterium]
MRLKITGLNPLSGLVKIGGAKNAALKVMAASLLAGGSCRLMGIPKITDVNTMADVLRGLGATVDFQQDSSILIDPSGVNKLEPPEESVIKMRASIQVMGPLLARFGYVRTRQPGGCDIGPRPIDLHLKGFSALGAEIKKEHGYISAKASKLKGTEILLDVPSVGATENIMTAACLAEGITVLRNAAREPEIIDEQNFLNRLGANIKGAGTDTIKIEGVRELKATEYTIIPDRIEAATFMLAIAVAGGEALIENVIVEHQQALIAKLRETGMELIEGDNYVIVGRPVEKRLKATNIRTLPYPGFPTDVQPQFVAAMSLAEGTSEIIEGVFPLRFKYTEELTRMGAKATVDGKLAIITGVPGLHGIKLEAPDLRGGAALVLAALAGEGVTELKGLKHIDRGYEDLPGKLRLLGASIERTGIRKELQAG